MTLNKNSVKKRLIQRVLIASTIIVAVVTILETYFAYQTEILFLEESQRQIEKDFLPVLSENVWQLDRDDILSQLGLILSQPMVEHVQLGIEQGETLTVGYLESQKTEKITHKLTHEHNGQQLQIGAVIVTVGYDHLYSQAKVQLLTNFLGSSAIVFFVSFFVVFLARNLITRHLVDISKDLSNTHGRLDVNRPLALNRRPSKSNRGDELDNVVNAINDMRTNIVSAYAKTQKSEERLSQIAENSVMWIWEVDKNGLYTYCSNACEYIFGYSAKDIIGNKHFFDLFHPDDREELKQAAFAVFENHQNFKEFENRNVNRLGEPVWLSTSGVAVVDKDGLLVGYRGVDIDITERKKLMEEQSRAAQLAALGTVAAGVAHEINNPIQGIMNYAALIKRAPDRVERNSDFAARIITESKRIAKITQDLLYYSRDTRIEKRETDVKETIEGALSLIATITRNQNIFITTDIQASLPKANWQPQSIQQIILNLVDNAYDALRAKTDSIEEKTIEVGARLLKNEEQKMIAIEVQDNGIGMSEEVILKAQEAFFTTKPPSEGTGLGLSIVNDIVSKHNGAIRINSKEGQFTRFTITLPLS